MEFHFRPHHFLCALCFQGRGYSPAFVANFQTIMNILNAPDGDNVAINIVNHTDSICSPCPSRQDKLCAAQEKVAQLDQAHAAALQIEDITTITWGEAKQRIAKNISLATHDTICTGCEWKEYKICEGVLRDFLADNTKK